MANKGTIINNVVEKVGISKKDATSAVEVVIDSFKESLLNGENMSIIDFGTMSVHHRAPRKGRNPQTGKEIDIPASQVPKFKPAKAFKDLFKDIEK